MRRANWIVVAAWLGMLLLPDVALAAGPKKVVYPKELLGVWDVVPDQGRCKVSDEGSDVRFELTPSRLIGYEDWAEPLSVVLISHRPKAWRIKSRLHIYEEAFEVYKIYSLPSKTDSVLAVVSSSQANVYDRCR